MIFQNQIKVEKNKKNPIQTNILREGVNKGNIKEPNNIDKSKILPPPPPKPHAKQ
jgi:hypothetical protein